MAMIHATFPKLAGANLRPAPQIRTREPPFKAILEVRTGPVGLEPREDKRAGRVRERLWRELASEAETPMREGMPAAILQEPLPSLVPGEAAPPPPTEARTAAAV